MLYYFKKYKNHSIGGGLVAAGVGMAFIVFIQKIVLVGIPTIWSKLDLLMVNSFGLPVNSGIIPLVILLLAGFAWAFRWSLINRKQLAQQLIA